MYPLIIEPAALESMMDDENLLVVDLCREETWLAAHLPGAVHVSPAELVSGIKPAVGKLPEMSRLETLFGRIGYRASQHIVAYDDEGGGWAGRFLWTLDMIGHAAKSLLNGGIISWAAEGRNLTDEFESPVPTAVSLALDARHVATLQQVLDSLDDDETLVWDARSPEEYAGTRVVSARGGHIPGAINLDWLEVMDRTNHLRIRKDIAELLNARGITRDKKVITHCQTHHRSGLTYVVGKSLGYDIRAYDGSWSEWGNLADTPIETQ